MEAISDVIHCGRTPKLKLDSEKIGITQTLGLGYDFRNYAVWLFDAAVNNNKGRRRGGDKIVYFLGRTIKPWSVRYSGILDNYTYTPDAENALSGADAYDLSNAGINLGQPNTNEIGWGWYEK